jgi:hypothetical protein
MISEINVNLDESFGYDATLVVYRQGLSCTQLSRHQSTYASEKEVGDDEKEALGKEKKFIVPSIKSSSHSLRSNGILSCHVSCRHS